MSVTSTDPKTITMPKDAMEKNGHVNNVVYAQWTQDVTVEHCSPIGGVDVPGSEATWVVREHRSG